ncbi:hypothetical protein [Granulicella arctica]|uniref:hypothetical protein n=1 Tax=Granulicella arctica TaxID=940613 RepID=UPI0021E01336|nr:hypothetical protein [Granulicella arctica]
MTSDRHVEEQHLMCPSAQPEMMNSRVLGVVGGTLEAPALAYLNQFLPVTDELLEMTQPAKPTQVMRFAAPCQEKLCSHFDGKDCGLVTRIVQILPAVTEALPPCLIRIDCRWFQQAGRSACQRCPQVVTQIDEPTDSMRMAALGHL